MLLVAVVCLLNYLSNRFHVEDALRIAVNRPPDPYACGSVRLWRGAEAPEPGSVPRNTLVATFAQRNQADATFAELGKSLPPSAALTQFGSTLFLDLPASDTLARQSWFDKLQPKCPKLFVSPPEGWVEVRLSAVAPSIEVAEKIEIDAKAHLQAGLGMHLIPPWMKNDERSPADRAQHLKARRTYASVSGQGDPLLDTSAQKREGQAHWNKMRGAAQGNDIEGARRLVDELQKRSEEVSQEQVARLRQLGEDVVDFEILDIYSEWQAEIKRQTDLARDSRPTPEPGRSLVPLHAKYMQAFADRMGSLPMKGNEPDPRYDIYSARPGRTRRAQTLLSFDHLLLADVAVGLPTFAEWLCAQGCTNLTWEITGGEQNEPADVEDREE